MKYKDRNTIRNNNKWQNRPFDDVKSMERERKKRIKKNLLMFSYRVSDKIWWASLSDNDKINVLNEYIHQCLDIWGYGYVVNFNDFEKIPKSKHNEVMNFLYKKYIPIVSKKRDLVLREVLGFLP